MLAYEDTSLANTASIVPFHERDHTAVPRSFFAGRAAQRRRRPGQDAADFGRRRQELPGSSYARVDGMARARTDQQASTRCRSRADYRITSLLLSRAPSILNLSREELDLPFDKGNDRGRSSASSVGELDAPRYRFST